MGTGARSAGQLWRLRRLYALWGRLPRLYEAGERVALLGRSNELRRAAVDSLHAGTGARILDLGCGTGRNFPCLEEAIGRRGQVVGIDYSAQMLTSARRRCEAIGWQNVKLIRSDAAALGIDRGRFDGVIASLAMGSIPDYQGALRESHEVLRAGARLVVFEAELYKERFEALNPVLARLYTALSGWDGDRDIPAAMREVFGSVEVCSYNFGSATIAVSMRSSPCNRDD